MKYNQKLLITLSISMFIAGLAAGYFFLQSQISEHQENEMKQLRSDISEKDLELKAYQISTEAYRAKIKIYRDMLADADNQSVTNVAP